MGEDRSDENDVARDDKACWIMDYRRRCASDMGSTVDDAQRSGLSSMYLSIP